MYRHRPHKRADRPSPAPAATPADRRLRIVRFAVFLSALIIVARLVVLMVFSHGFYETLASNARDVFERLQPDRGDVFLRDRDGKLYPVATNHDSFTIFAEPRRVTRPVNIAEAIAPMLALDPLALGEKLKGTGLYTPIARGVPEELADQITAALAKDGLEGIGMSRESARSYPEPAMGGHLLGFVGSDADGQRSGRYGVEGYWDKELAGTAGFIAAEKDVAGRWIPVADRKYTPATDGADIVLTIDRTIQFFACEKLKTAVERHGATGGSVVIMDPKTGAILAMCGAPDFNPNEFRRVEDIAVFNNPAIFAQYEPGSVMKAFTLAAAVDQGKVGPKSTYTDEGEVKLGPYTIKNSDGQAHGVQTMTEVLEKSLNTGAIYAARTIGTETFREYLRKFGFGERTGIELDTEVKGDLSPLSKRGEIFTATASYGQGITATPIQLVAAFAALANGGALVAPHVVSEIRWSPTHVEQVETKVVRNVVSQRTATLLGGMLVSVVENGHGKHAGVPGYWVAGKTGTAQIAKKGGGGYEKDVTIGTFIGFAPVEDPKFVMSVRIDKPNDTSFAESTAAPVFGEIAAFLLKYLQIEPTRR